MSRFRTRRLASADRPQVLCDRCGITYTTDADRLDGPDSTGRCEFCGGTIHRLAGPLPPVPPRAA